MRIHSRNAFWLVIVVMLVTGHRLPAPISEETPTPAPKPEAVAKSKAKSDNAEKKSPPKVKQSPFAPFAGVWTGSVKGGFNSDIGLNVSATNATTIRIGADGSVYNDQSSQNVSRPLLSADGHTLTWNYQYSDSNGTGHGTASLRLIGPKTATYKAEIIVNTPSGNGVLKSLGTLTKQ
jgi:hypothetical protein